MTLSVLIAALSADCHCWSLPLLLVFIAVIGDIPQESENLTGGKNFVCPHQLGVRGGIEERVGGEARVTAACGRNCGG